jgi:hypothetical protein
MWIKKPLCLNCGSISKGNDLATIFFTDVSSSKKPAYTSFHDVGKKAKACH